MQQMNSMDDLLSGILSGTITPGENEYLYRFLNEADHEEEVTAWLQEQWDKQSWQIEEMADDVVFTRIKTEIENQVLMTGQQSAKPDNEKSTGRLKKPDAVTRSLKWKMVFRYAAIFIIAFGLSWVIHTMIVPQTGNMAVVEEKPLFIEVLVPYGAKNIVILPDSSKVCLNAGARLKYPIHYDGEIREVHLQGEGFFDVTHDEDHPFIVKTNGLDVKVLGTKFNLMANADDNTIEATLVEGAIEILNVKDAKNNNLKMTPGQKLTVQKEKGSYSVIDKEEETMLMIPKEVDEPVKIQNPRVSEKAELVELSTAWTENRMVFNKERFEIVKTRLERWYGVEIEVRNPEILEYRFTGTFDMETFEQAMSALSEAAQCVFKVDKAHVIVTKKVTKK
jgi:ferric-dicitrate binding protein FerR (iron transport regulator)